MAMKIAQLLQPRFSSKQNCKNVFTLEMRTFFEEVNVTETFWPRQGEMIVVMLKAAKEHLLSTPDLLWQFKNNNAALIDYN